MAPSTLRSAMFSHHPFSSPSVNASKANLRWRIRRSREDAGADRDGIPRPSGSHGLPSGPREPDLSSGMEIYHIAVLDRRGHERGPSGHGRFLLAPPARTLVGREHALARVTEELIQQVDVKAALGQCADETASDVMEIEPARPLKITLAERDANSRHPIVPVDGSGAGRRREHAIVRPAA